MTMWPHTADELIPYLGRLGVDNEGTMFTVVELRDEYFPSIWVIVPLAPHESAGQWLTHDGLVRPYKFPHVEVKVCH